MFEKKIIAALKKCVKGEVVLEVPPDSSLGDFSFPCFSVSKQLKKNPAEIAKDIANSIALPDFVSRTATVGAYVNFFLNTQKIASHLFEEALSKKKSFGSSEKNGKVVAIDFSSPNIGKPMHFGHLRSTVIGHSLARLHEFNGNKVVRLNYVGDWGTQFGKLIYAYLEWGDKKKLEEHPIKHLSWLYAKFCNEETKNPELTKSAREWFSRLEKSDAQALSLWSRFRHLSIDEFRKIYGLLDIEFDDYNGESFYAQKVEKAISRVGKLAVLDQSALIVRLDGFEMPLMLKKSDESTTYASRDIAAIFSRFETLKFDSLLYVVGHEQSLHFAQLFALMKLLGIKKNFVHVSHGLYLSPEGGKMAARKGKVVLMEDVLNETISLARKIIEEKNPKLKNKEEISRKVAVGAIFFGDLLNDRVKDVVFDIKRILSFEGDTGPYLMYTHARACGILDKAKAKSSKKCKVELLVHASEEQLIRILTRFPDKIKSALDQLKPHILAQYLAELGRDFNEFYHACPCIQDNRDLMIARLTLVEVSRQVLENGLFLLGISAVREM